MIKTKVKKIDHFSVIPLHKQIEEILRELIDSGKFSNGKLFPNEVELSNTFGVSRNTVRQAFKSLVNEGLLYRKAGVGTKVREREVVTHLQQWHSFTRDMKAQGIAIQNYKVNFSEVSSDSELAEVFAIDEGRPIMKLERVRGDAQYPFVVFESWFHPRIPLKHDQQFTQPLNDILEEQYNVIAVKSSEKLQAITADKRISKLLLIPEGSPIFYRKRIVYDIGMRIIEYNKCYYRHDKMTYKIEINRTVQ